MKLKLIDNQDRSKLNEGRTQGFGGGFALVQDENVTMVTPLSACAEYLNDFISSQYTGKEWNSYGFHSKKIDGVFDLKNNITHLVNGILPTNRYGKHSLYDQEVSALEENYKHIEKFLNWFEKRFNVPQLTKITKIEDNRFLFTFDLWWTKGFYLISLYKGLCRMAIYFNDKQEPLDYLNGLQTHERYEWNSLKAKVMDMLDGFIPEEKITNQNSCPHSCGIINFQWPRKLKNANEIKKT